MTKTRRVFVRNRMFFVKRHLEMRLWIARTALHSLASVHDRVIGECFVKDS